MTSYVKSVQQVSITIASGSTTATATINPVDLTKAMIVYQGLTASSTSALQSVVSRVELTNATTVTATRGASNSDTVTVCAVVVEFASDVNSIQAGTINLNAALSGTATISAVGSNAFVLWLGQSSATAGTALSRITTAVQLTNSTTVTAFAGTTNSNMTVGYMVVDLSSNVVNSVQKLAHTDTSNTTSYADTITSVVAANTILLANGDTLAGGASGSSFEATRQLTSSTAVTYTIGTAAATSKTHYTTVLEFKGAALNSSVQRGTNALVTASSHTATIGPVNPSYAFCNLAGWRMTGATPNVAYPTQVLTNATTVTSALNSAGAAVTSYEVAEFIAPASAGNSAGAGTAQATGAATSSSAASGAGLATVQAAGACISAAFGPSSGVASATAAGNATATATAGGSGLGVASGVGQSIARTTGVANGSSATQAAGAFSAGAVGSSAGVSSATGVSNILVASAASASGVSVATGIGGSTCPAIASSAGAGAAQAGSTVAIAGIGASAAGSGAIAISTSLAQAIASAAGSGTGSGMGLAFSTTPTAISRFVAADFEARNVAADLRQPILNADAANRII